VYVGSILNMCSTSEMYRLFTLCILQWSSAAVLAITHINTRNDTIVGADTLSRIPHNFKVRSPITHNTHRSHTCAHTGYTYGRGSRSSFGPTHLQLNTRAPTRTHARTRAPTRALTRARTHAHRFSSS
jgi:hypothetical protein